jgi:hypothetical protein
MTSRGHRRQHGTQRDVTEYVETRGKLQFLGEQDQSSVRSPAMRWP